VNAYESDNSLAQAVCNLSIPYVDKHYGLADGIIDPYEYSYNYTDPSTGITVYLEHNSTIMYVGLKAQTTGWIGISWKDVGEIFHLDGLNNSDIIIGYAPDGAYEPVERVQPSDPVTVHYVLSFRNGTFEQENDAPNDDSTTPISQEGLLEAYKEQIYGMRIGESKHFVIPAEQGYTSPEARLYGEDLEYVITLTRIDDNFDNPADSSAIVYSDRHGVDTFGHIPDANQSQVISANGTDDGSITQLEYFIRMNSTDANDIALLNGSDVAYPFVLLTGPSDDFTDLPVQHTEWSNPLTMVIQPNDAPHLEVISPAANSTLEWTVFIQLNATDSSIIRRAGYRFEDTNWTDLDYNFKTDLWAGPVDLSDFEDGPTTLYLNATDPSNRTSVITVNVTVGNPIVPLAGMRLSVAREFVTMMYHADKTNDQFTVTNTNSVPIGALEFYVPTTFESNYLSIEAEDSSENQLVVDRLPNTGALMRWRVYFYEPVDIGDSYTFTVVTYFQSLHELNNFDENLYDISYLKYPIVPHVLQYLSFSFGFRSGDSLVSENIEGSTTNIAPMTVEPFTITIKSFTPHIVATRSTRITLDPWGWLHYEETISLENIGPARELGIPMNFPAYMSNVEVFDRVGILATSQPDDWEWNATLKQQINLQKDRFGRDGFWPGYKYTFNVHYDIHLPSYQKSGSVGDIINLPMSDLGEINVKEHIVDFVLPLSVGVTEASGNYRLLHGAFYSTLRYTVHNTTQFNPPDITVAYVTTIGAAARPAVFGSIIGVVALIYVAYRGMKRGAVGATATGESEAATTSRQVGAPPELLRDFASSYSRKTSLGLDLEKLESARKRGKVTKKEFMIRERDIKSQLDEIDSELADLKQEMMSHGSKYRDIVAQLELQEERIAGAKAGLRQLLLRKKKQKISRAAFERSRQDYLKTIKQAISTTDRTLLSLEEEAGEI
jgi:hypothetical protein